MRALALWPLLAARVAGAAPLPAADSTSATGGTVLHLEDALRMSLRGNWDLRSAGSAVAIAEAGVRAARTLVNPAVAVATSKIHVDGRGDATPLGNDLWSRGYDTVAQLGQLIEIGGKRAARTGSARATAEGAGARLADARRRLAEETVRAYAGAALAEANARIARESAGYLRDEARIAAVRWTAGDISSSDRDQIEIAASRLELDASAAVAEARAQRLALGMLLGLTGPAADVIVADSLEALAERPDIVTGPIPSGERADLASARADLRRAESELRLQRAQRIPDPTLVAQFEHAPPDRPNSVGVGIALPLPLWNWNRGAIAAARAARDDAALAVERIEAQVASDRLTARVRYEEASARWRRCRDDLRPRSESVRRTVSLAYEKGGASLLDLLQAQRNDNDIRLASMQAASDAAVAAAALAAAYQPMSPESTRP